MWQYISSKILRFRILLLVVVSLFTLFMMYNATKVEMSYEYAPLLPKSDSASIQYQEFVSRFGEEGNIITIGIVDSNFFSLDNFENWKNFCNELSEIDGVENMISIPNAFHLIKNKEEKKFDLERIFEDSINSQAQLDSMSNIFHSLPLYRGYLYNDSTKAYLVALTMNKDRMKTKERETLVKSIQKVGANYEKSAEVDLIYSGLPYIRVVNSIMIKKEIFLFTGLALLICVLILYIFFRSFKAMLFPAIVVMAGVFTALGSMALLDYHITILTGMIPPLLIVIGIPNSIFMLNKYHNEYKIHGNKIKALKRVIVKIGNAIFLTNLTTASGFVTFTLTSSKILKEFGAIAAINIFALFVLSLLLIPTIFSFLPPPEDRHLKHLERKGVSKIIEKLSYISNHKRTLAYIIMTAVILVSAYGMTRMKTTGYMVDDIPPSDPIYKDLKFFEKNFEGVMPLEIIIDTRKPNGVLRTSTMLKMEQLEKQLQNYDELSSSISYLNVVKMAKQAFYNGNEQYYSLPKSTEKNFILSYATNANSDISMAHAFIDSTKQTARISIRMKDVGTKRMDQLYQEFMKEIHEIFPIKNYDVTVTGSSVVFFRGNQYLVKNLFISLALAIGLIAIFMAIMFKSPRMVLMSLIPNLIPLLFTAGLMGFAGIPIKASTILVFSIAFGISVDNTIHFLAKYRQELSVNNWDIQKSVMMALKETGFSMIYTSTVLFFGFGIFSLSNFGGTQAMGVLVSLTLLVALISNLVLLPSLLIGLEKIIRTKSLKEPMLQIFNEEEDIDLDELEIEKPKDQTNQSKES